MFYIAFITMFFKFIYQRFTRKPIVPGKGYKPIEKHKFNPFLKYPRNESCYCGSGQKYKKCCMSTEPDAVPEEIASKATKLVKKIRSKKKNG